MTAEALYRAFADLDLPLTDGQIAQFLQYDARLRAANRHMNLTAITAPREVLEKHFIDSALVLHYVNEPGQRLIDIGSGAGFPGMVLAILRPDWEILLLDSLQKRVDFLRTLAGALGLSDRVRALHGRAEALGHDPAYRERFDLATGRAVTQMGGFLEYALPFVRIGGLVAVLKGPGDEGTLADIVSAADSLGGTYRDTLAYTLPGGDDRRLWRFDKTATTPANYPRRPKAMRNRPLVPQKGDPS